jgi:murein L,D-transpeptidase YcbB/YkuD
LALAGLFLLGLGTCTDPRAPWLPRAADAAPAPQSPDAARDVFYVDRELVRAELVAAGDAARTNPLYRALASLPATPDRRRDLERLRLVAPARRFVLVDTASGRLWMIEDGAVAGTMKVVTGKTGMETPQMAALIRHAVLDPYWNLPPDLVRERALHGVLMNGPDWLRYNGLRPVSSYEEDARPLDPEAVDWIGVAHGEDTIGLRQDPGPLNTMGAVKFMFPNRLGIYLHDTPERRLFRAADRRFSSGCVRREDAGALYRWLFDEALPPRDPGRPERRVALPEPVPVYILDLPSLSDASVPRPRRTEA